MVDGDHRVGRRRIYETTGIQFHSINTLNQLYAACRTTLAVVEAACTLLTIADYFNYRLTGSRCTEYTIASTTQCLDARTRAWAVDLLSEVGIPSRLFAPIVEPGTVIGAIAGDDGSPYAGTPVVATACHDTASAFAAVRTGAATAVLSSGTWSLLGAELSAPILSAAARDANFTNEGGTGGTIRFLKNISGLWLLEACRQSWEAAGRRDRYEDLLAAAADAPAFRSLVDPDCDEFLNPDDMPLAIDRYCRRTEQPAPHDPPGTRVRSSRASRMSYRLVLESLESLTGVRVEEIRVIGGGSRNRLLNQFTADASGRCVVAGPVEATALGNIAVQMLATGAVGSLGTPERSSNGRFPSSATIRSCTIAGTRSTVDSRTTWRMAVGEVLAPGTGRLENLWDEDAIAGLGLGADASAKAADPLRLLRYRSNLLGADLRITNFAGGNTSAKFDRPDPLTGEVTRVLAVKGSGGDLGSMNESGFAVLRLDALEQPRVALSRRSVRRRDGGPLSAVRVRRQSRGRIDRHAAACAPAVRARRSPAPRLGDCAGGERQRRAEARGIQRALRASSCLDSVEAARLRARDDDSAGRETEPACDGLVLASHGLFTWGDTARACYANSIATIDQLGAFVDEHRRRSTRPLFGGPASMPQETDCAAAAARLLPRLRGQLSSTRRVVAHWNDSDDARTFAGSAWAADLCRAGTSCPDHFLRTRICPMFVPPASRRPRRVSRTVPSGYVAYYHSFAQPDSPALRDANPSVVVVPELGVFGFGKDEREARITSEFFLNAIHVMAGATALDDDESQTNPESRIPNPGAVHNYVALSRSEAFGIEYLGARGSQAAASAARARI